MDFAHREGLTIGFSISRTMSASPDTARVEIVNLDPVRASAMGAALMATGRATLEVSAGYDDTSARIFRGDVRRMDTSRRQGADLITTITADDGGDAIADVPIRVTNAGMTAAQMIDVAAAAMGVALHPSAAEIVARADTGTQGPYTAVMVGRASELLDAACRRLRCRWWLRDGQVHLSSLGRVAASRPAVLLTPQVLVSEPSLVGAGLVSFAALLDPNHVPGSQVSYEGRAFRVEGVVHSGQTRGSAWVSQITGRAL